MEEKNIQNIAADQSGQTQNFDGENPAQPKLFTQEEVDRVVETRLKRERKKFAKENYADRIDAEIAPKGAGKAVFEETAEKEDDFEETAVYEEAQSQIAATDTGKLADEKIAEDLSELTARFPNVAPVALFENKAFLKFCKGKLSRFPLWEIYQDFCEITSGAADNAALIEIKKEARSTSSSGGGGSYSGLSDSQKEVLEDWNRRYPNEAMSAKEFKQYFSS